MMLSGSSTNKESSIKEKAKAVDYIIEDNSSDIQGSEEENQQQYDGAAAAAATTTNQTF